MKKLFTAELIRQWDAQTILREKINSVELMERAAKACVEHLKEIHPIGRLTFVCGTGNNGGDGLAMARIFSDKNHPIDHIYIIGDENKGSSDFKINLQRLKEKDISFEFVKSLPDHFFAETCIDALFGSGLDRLLGEPYQTIVQHMNQGADLIVSIDVPSGLPADIETALAPPFDQPFTCIDADLVLTFQQWKTSFFMPVAAQILHRKRVIEVVDIELDTAFHDETESQFYTFDLSDAREIRPLRSRFSHKGTYGSALIACGSEAMPGAAILATKSALHSGCGLVYAHVPSAIRSAMMHAAPEAIVQADVNEAVISEVHIPSKINAIALGCGMGTDAPSKDALSMVLKTFSGAIVLDADALNIIAESPALGDAVAAHGKCVLTPHPGEFDRLFKAHQHPWERIETARKQAKRLQAVIHLKGAFSATVHPTGQVVINTSGSSAMAIGGSGDVLTGLICGLLAQGMTTGDATMLGAYIHGLSGELYEESYTNIGLTAGWLTNFIPLAWRRIDS